MMRITSKGQVTIPREIRERAGLLPHTEVDFEFDGKVVRLLPARNRKRTGRGARFVAHLRRRGDVAMSTDRNNGVGPETTDDPDPGRQQCAYVHLESRPGGQIPARPARIAPGSLNPVSIKPLH
jgi:AbrB family looped-hinge helix DNA binding protein